MGGQMNNIEKFDDFPGRNELQKSRADRMQKEYGTKTVKVDFDIFVRFNGDECHSHSNFNISCPFAYNEFCVLFQDVIECHHVDWERVDKNLRIGYGSGSYKRCQECVDRMGL